MTIQRLVGFPPLFFILLFVVLVGLVSFVLWEWILTNNFVVSALEQQASKNSQELVAPEYVPTIALHLHYIRRMTVAALSVLVVILVLVAFASCAMFQFTSMYQKREMFLSASLIKQMESTQQAERKSMNKSLAFASVSHDVRTSLAGITGLIDISRNEVPENSELYNNFNQMTVCTSKLLDILNSVLDMSKVEAGKMQLEEIEFDMARVIEESVDMFYVVGLRKGLEVIWDPCDCSILKKTMRVKGDCRRLKQILDNLLGNAVKFTSSGHVVLRAWAKPPSLSQDSNLSTGHNCQPKNIWDHPLAVLFCKNGGSSYEDANSLVLAHSNPDHIEFVFEVDDTGIGIPKEKRASVFENYIQVKESAYEEHHGTGLGLGIVQSYVRLMGGEIGIVDKKINEKGTCFGFNIFLKSVETPDETERQQADASPDTNSSPILCEPQWHPELSASPEIQEHAGLHEMIKTKSMFMASSSSKGLRKDGIHIHALLFLQGKEARRITQSWMENLGVRVQYVNSLEQFCYKLERLRHGLVLGYSSGGGGHKVYSDHSPSSISDREFERSPSCMTEGFDHHSLFINKRTFSRRQTMTHLLIIIDVFYKPLYEILMALESFPKEVDRHQYRIVWLVDANTPSTDFRRLKDVRTPCDLIIRKPLHGSRLSEVLRLLKELGGSNESSGQQSESVVVMIPEEMNDGLQKGSSSKVSKKDLINSTQSPPRTTHNEGFESKIKLPDAAKPLTGMHVLVVEDIPPLRLVASKVLARLGANVTFAENGEKAVSLVQEAFLSVDDDHQERDDAEKNQISKYFTYDLILMDCEMPVMNGYDATTQIRNIEKRFGLHIPIIATSAHEVEEQGFKSIQAGMDFHLTKPLHKDKLMDAIHKINSR